MVVVPTQQEIMTVAGVYKTSPASSLCCVQLLGLLGMNIQAVWVTHVDLKELHAEDWVLLIEEWERKTQLFLGRQLESAVKVDYLCNPPLEFC